jgi:hypothetical protein
MAASEAENLARNALAKRSVYKQCLLAEAEPVSYSSSQVSCSPRACESLGTVRGRNSQPLERVAVKPGEGRRGKGRS